MKAVLYKLEGSGKVTIPKFVKQALDGQPLTIYGDGEQSRDFTLLEATMTNCGRLA